MKRKRRIARYTAAELAEMRRRGEDKTDWAKVEAMSEADIEHVTKNDPDENIEWGDDWIPLIPAPKRHLNLRIDGDIVDWFKAQGSGYQTRMNAVLRAYVGAQRKNADGKPRRRVKAVTEG